MNEENTIVDVIYDTEQIYHVLEPNEEGIRGISNSQMFLRDTIAAARVHLSHLDQTKIDEFEQELITNGQ
ncbi:hypothetical protein EI546_06615 [Aequorivita sp. H23M31]|uniref:Uncharacterized protein n=1 Tax=Aequorivita ciconiae TaxID=2494375 RepID=A0A410G2C8_9FLAO|nr:hypothetical protein [Aequorivita sp. H23M31]QAA81422.1 hypothetical protein EI546_06615 [Aequorivita sp. H23M31]